MRRGLVRRKMVCFDTDFMVALLRGKAEAVKTAGGNREQEREEDNNTFKCV